MTKFTINLLQPELIPETPFLTFKRVCIAWAILLAILLLTVFTTQYSFKTASAEYNKLNKENGLLTKSVSKLKVEISEFKPDEKVVHELERLKILMRNKQFFHQQLTDKNRTYVSGFSKAMDELSFLHDKNISLNRVYIKQDEMSFRGYALSPDAVPNWLSGFKNSALLSGKSFVHFDLKENSNQLTEFAVSTQPIENKVIDETSPVGVLK